MRNKKHTLIISLMAAAMAAVLVAGVLYYSSHRRSAVEPLESTPAPNAHAAGDSIKPDMAFSAKSSNKDHEEVPHSSSYAAGKIPAIPATIPPSALNKIKLPHGISFAQIPWINDPMRPLPQYVALAQAWYEPQLEQQRHRRQLADANVTDAAKSIQILTHFSNTVPIKTQEISPTHYALTFTGSQIRMYGGKCFFWFLFKVQGVKGKTIRFDLTNVNIKFWQTLNPVYSYASSVSSLRSLGSKPILSGNFAIVKRIWDEFSGTAAFLMRSGSRWRAEWNLTEGWAHAAA